MKEIDGKILAINKYWKELSLVERKEIVLKQELVQTQEKMAAGEKALRLLQTSIKEKTGSLMRIQQTHVIISQK